MARTVIDTVGTTDTLPSAFGKINAMTAELYPALSAPSFVTFGAGDSLDRLAFVGSAGFLSDTTSFRAVLKVRFSDPDAVSTNQCLLCIGPAGANTAQLVRLFLVDATRVLQLQCGSATAGTAGTYVYTNTAETYTLLLSYDGARINAEIRASVSVYDSTGQHVETIFGSVSSAGVLALSTATVISIGSVGASHSTPNGSYFQGDMGECRIWADPLDVLVDIDGPLPLSGVKERHVDFAGQPTVTGVTGSSFSPGRRYSLDGVTYTALSTTTNSVTFTSNLLSSFEGAIIELADATGVKASGTADATGQAVLTGLNFDSDTVKVGDTVSLSIGGNYTLITVGVGTVTLNAGLSGTYGTFGVGAYFTVIGGSSRTALPDLAGSSRLTGLTYDHSEMYAGAVITVDGNTYVVSSFDETVIYLTTPLLADVIPYSVCYWNARPGAHVHDALRSPPELGGSLAGRRPLVYFGGTQTAADWNAGTNQGTLGSFTMGGAVG